MKKYLLLLALVLAGAMWNDVEARWTVGTQKSASEIAVGDTIVLEFCTQSQFLGRYLTGSILGPSGVVTDDYIYVVEEGGAVDKRTEANTIRLKNKEKGYITYPGGWTDLQYSTSASDAADLQVLSCGEDIPWSTTERWGSAETLRDGFEEGTELIANWRISGSTRISTDSSVGFSHSYSTSGWNYLGSWNRDYQMWFWGYTDTNQWNVYTVTYSHDLVGDIQDLIDSYTDTVGDVTGGSLGFFSQTAADTYNTALANAKALLEGTYDDSEYYTAIKALKDAYAALADAVNPVSEGYYYIVSAGKGSGYSTTNTMAVNYDDEYECALYNDGGYVKWSAYDKTSPADNQIYYLTSDGGAIGMLRTSPMPLI